jgi:hypothetical protein
MRILKFCVTSSIFLLKKHIEKTLLLEKCKGNQQFMSRPDGKMCLEVVGDRLACA